MTKSRDWSSLWSIRGWPFGVPQIASVVGVVYGGFVLYRFWLYPALGKDLEGKLHILFWTIVPPVWFFAEYFYLKHFKRYDAARLGEAKTWQDFATKFWAGILAAMLFLTKGV